MLVIGEIIAGIGGISALIDMGMNGKNASWAGWGFLLFFAGALMVWFGS